MAGAPFLLLLCGAISVGKSAWAVKLQPDSTQLFGLQLGPLGTFTKTDGQVYHMEEDLFVPGNILFSDETTLRTTDGKRTHVIVGLSKQYSYAFGYGENNSTNARFRYITGFLQLNSTHVLVVDNNNHCLRLINRLFNSTSSFIGLCTSSGFQDGINTKARFNVPTGIVKDVRSSNRLLLTDTGNNALRSIDLVSRQVNTLVKSGSSGPYGALFDKGDQAIYLTYDTGLEKLDLNMASLSEVISPKNLNGPDAHFNQTNLVGGRELIRVNLDTFLVAESSAHTLRLVDTKQEFVRSICGGRAASFDGPITKCSLNNPYSLLLRGETLYIGELGSIRQITVRDYKPECGTKDISVVLAKGDKEAPVEVVPGLVVYFTLGKFQYVIPEDNCTVQITVEQDKSCTAPVEIYPSPKTGLASYTLVVGNQRQELQLPVGQYRFKDGNGCFVIVNVNNPLLMRRLDFVATYNIGCGVLDSGTAISLLKTIADQRYAHIEELCNGKCNKSADGTINLSCKDGVTTVTWPTSAVYDASVKSVPAEVIFSINQMMKARKNYLDLVVFSMNPPVVYPNVNSEGVLASLVLTPVCVTGSSYDGISGTCKTR